MTKRKTANSEKAVKREKPAAKSWLDCAPENSFWANDGKVLRNLKELPSALRNMSNDAFLHHVNDQKHDFANWIEHVFREKELADDVRKIKHKIGLAQKLEHHFNSFKPK